MYRKHDYIKFTSNKNPRFESAGQNLVYYYMMIDLVMGEFAK